MSPIALTSSSLGVPGAQVLFAPLAIGELLGGAEDLFVLVLSNDARAIVGGVILDRPVSRLPRGMSIEARSYGIVGGGVCDPIRIPLGPSGAATED
jgi:hypothetical protein